MRTVIDADRREAKQQIAILLKNTAFRQERILCQINPRYCTTSEIPRIFIAIVRRTKPERYLDDVMIEISSRPLSSIDWEELR